MTTAPERFRVLFFDDAKAQGLPGLGKWNDFGYALYDFATDPPTLIATDDMQPEDATFARDLAWVPELLNRLAESARAIDARLTDSESGKATGSATHSSTSVPSGRSPR